MSNAERARRDYLKLYEAEIGLASEFLRSESPDPALDTRLSELDIERQRALDQMNASLKAMGLIPFPWMSREDLLLFLRRGEDIPTPPSPQPDG
jgi:hypothetical protein